MFVVGCHFTRGQVRNILCNNSGDAFARWLRKGTMCNLLGVILPLSLNLPLRIFLPDYHVSHIPHHLLLEITEETNVRFLHLFHKQHFYLKEEYQDGFIDQFAFAPSKGSVLGLCLILVETLIAGGVYNCRKTESTTVPRSPPATSISPFSPLLP